MKGKTRPLIQGATILGMLAVFTLPAAAQLIDNTQAPNTAKAGINKALLDEIGAGRGDAAVRRVYRQPSPFLGPLGTRARPLTPGSPGNLPALSAALRGWFAGAAEKGLVLRSGAGAEVRRYPCRRWARC